MGDEGAAETLCLALHHCDHRNRRRAYVGIDVENGLRDPGADIERRGRRLAWRIGEPALAEMRPLRAHQHELDLLAAARFADGASEEGNFFGAHLVACGAAGESQRGEAPRCVFFDAKSVRFHQSPVQIAPRRRGRTQAPVVHPLQCPAQIAIMRFAAVAWRVSSAGANSRPAPGCASVIVGTGEFPCPARMAH